MSSGVREADADGSRRGPESGGGTAAVSGDMASIASRNRNELSHATGRRAEMLLRCHMFELLAVQLCASRSRFLIPSNGNGVCPIRYTQTPISCFTSHSRDASHRP